MNDSKKITFFAGLAFTLLPFLLYLNILRAPFIFDDYNNIINNSDIRQLGNLKNRLIYRSAYDIINKNDPSRPLVYLTFSINYWIGKLNPLGYHLFNVMIHIFNALLIFFLTSRTFLYAGKLEEADGKDGRDESENTSILFAFATALLFALHPIQTEAVTYISPRSDSLATLFYLSSLLFFTQIEKRNLFAILSLLSFALSLFSKQIAVTLPAMTLMYDLFFISNFDFRQMLKRKAIHLSYWLILIAFLIYRRVYFGGIGDMATNPYGRWTHLTYLLHQPAVILNYIQLLAVPVGQCIDHYILPSKNGLGIKIILSSVFVGMILTFPVVAMIKRNKFQSSGISPVLLRLISFSTLWFFITLSPTSSFFPIRDAMTERRLYLPSLGFALGIVSVYFCFAGNDRRRRWIFCLTGLHILTLGIFTWKRNQKYQNPALLWQEAIVFYPDNPRAYNNLGHLYVERNQDDQALLCYQKSAALNPNDALPYNNLGLIYERNRHHDLALQSYETAVKVNPKDVYAYYNLANLYRKDQQIDKAMEFFEKTIALNPEYPDAYYRLGNLYYENKDYPKATQLYQKVIEIDPRCGAAYNSLGNIYYQHKDYAKALWNYQKAVELNPDDRDALYNFNMLLAALKSAKKS